MKQSELSHSPEIALLIGTLFKQLGGDLTIGPDGKRYCGVPEPYTFDTLPQVSALEPCFQPLNDEQYRGAMRLVSGLLHRLCKEDKNFLFDLLGNAYVDPEARPI